MSKLWHALMSRASSSSRYNFVLLFTRWVSPPSMLRRCNVSTFDLIGRRPSPLLIL